MSPRMHIRPIPVKISWWTIFNAKRLTTSNCVGAKTLYKALHDEGLIATFGDPIIWWGDTTGIMEFGERVFNISTTIDLSMNEVWWPKKIVFTFKDVTPH